MGETVERLSAILGKVVFVEERTGTGETAMAGRSRNLLEVARQWGSQDLNPAKAGNDTGESNRN